MRTIGKAGGYLDAQIAETHALLAIHDQLGALTDVLAHLPVSAPSEVDKQRSIAAARKALVDQYFNASLDDKEQEMKPTTDEDGEEIAPQWMVIVRQKRTPGSALHPWMVHFRTAWSAEEAVNRLDIPPGAMAYAVQCQLVAEFIRDEQAPLRRLP